MRVPHSNAFIDLNKDFTAGESEAFMQSLVPGNTGEMQLSKWMQDIAAHMCYTLQIWDPSWLHVKFQYDKINAKNAPAST